MPVGQFGSLNFAILVTCGHSFKLIIKGNILDEDGAEIEDVVDFLLNKIDFRFSIEEPIIASNLQFMDRKNGINTVYMKLYKEVSTVVDSIQRLRKE